VLRRFNKSPCLVLAILMMFLFSFVAPFLSFTVHAEPSAPQPMPTPKPMPTPQPMPTPKPMPRGGPGDDQAGQLGSQDSGSG
jgi:hypothetical protein